MLPKVQVRPKCPPFGFFSALCDFFRKFLKFIKGYPLAFFLKFSVCRKRWMSLNGLFLSFSAFCDLKNTFFRKKISKIIFLKFFFPNFYNSCSLNIFEPKIWRRLGTFPSCFSSDYNPHTDRSTFLTILTILKSYNCYLANLKYWRKSLRSSIFTSSKKLKRTKGYALLRVFSALWDFFSKKFLMSQNGPPSSFLMFCNWMYVNQSQGIPLLHFSALCVFFERIFFQKLQVFFQKKCFALFEP